MSVRWRVTTDEHGTRRGVRADAREERDGGFVGASRGDGGGGGRRRHRRVSSGGSIGRRRSRGGDETSRRTPRTRPRRRRGGRLGCRRRAAAGGEGDAAEGTIAETETREEHRHTQPRHVPGPDASSPSGIVRRETHADAVAIGESRRRRRRRVGNARRRRVERLREAIPRGRPPGFGSGASLADVVAETNADADRNANADANGAGVTMFGRATSWCRRDDSRAHASIRLRAPDASAWSRRRVWRSERNPRLFDVPLRRRVVRDRRRVTSTSSPSGTPTRWLFNRDSRCDSASRSAKTTPGFGFVNRARRTRR